MNWDMWAKIEAILYESGVKPIVAVVPDNKDPLLNVGPARESFWDAVRTWQANGWAIAIHGFQHLYVTDDCGLLGLQNRSEFAGLPYHEQARKLALAQEIFRREDIDPKIWVAPSHSFDATTVRVLHESGVCIVSDGLFPLPHQDQAGMLWIPQQLWRFRKVPRGIWTVCYHHNDWTEEQLRRFRQDVRRFREQIVSPSEICEQYAGRHKSVSDRLGALAMAGCIRGMDYFGRLQNLAAR
ncbi:MAG: DUF2334 domain-containing protein [Acidobacteriota bacterium]|nr:DUF2334 domain-containing protein [Acidobacteriota bacterium]